MFKQLSDALRDEEFCKALDEQDFIKCTELIGRVNDSVIVELRDLIVKECNIDIFMLMDTLEYFMVPQTGKVYNVPNHIKKIGYRAFVYSPAEHIVLPEGVEVIEANAFAGSSATRIDIPKTVHTVNSGAFSNTPVKYVDLSNVKDIGAHLFTYCSELERVDLPSTLKKIPYSMFYKCSKLKTIDLPSTLESISWDAFACSGLERIEFPEGLSVIGEQSFYDCSNLKEVIIPDTVHVVNRKAFKIADNGKIYCNPKDTWDEFFLDGNYKQQIVIKDK